VNTDNLRTIYLLGIGGIAMGTLASMLKAKGFHVVGSDQNVYPPMSTHLEHSGIPFCEGYRAEHLKQFEPDLVVVGNVIRRENPEAQAILQNGTPCMSMPQAIAHFFLPHHKSLVVAGTHGKSTTSSLLAWVLTHAGFDPSAFIGGMVKEWDASFRLGKGRFMVIEGDEYDTAFFDKGPKFLHYQPHIGVVTSIEYDHADIFPDLDAIRQAFSAFARLIPADGSLIVNADDDDCMECARFCRGRVFTFGRAPRADWRLMSVDYRPGEVRFVYDNPLSNRRGELVSRMPGRHNVGNALAALAVASLAGMEESRFQDGLLTFPGVRRRQDVLGEACGVLVIDDFAHHPTAVQATLSALRHYYPERRLIAAFEPRTNSSRRSVFQTAYGSAFDDADLVCISRPPGLEAIPEAERLDPLKLSSDIAQRGREVYSFTDTESLLDFLRRSCTVGDVVVCMSNGSFDGIPRRLMEALTEAEKGKL
jgi:UDP-N-acetylmuramate: L-alanyl-gamma-D-glutamyl-meso-diaminopimelate ligase